ncbi:MAG: nucleotidyl transferase AbiEii/AbiGii toxin family protein [Saprospiraceae bacterium]|nr:nucleotidyl transferase AbiEii/AbiGii toxin family protein [Saprospiraceae bacterium]
MLQLSAIRPELLYVLRQLMSLGELNKFYLVGGTALALQYGHRLSVDIDLFSSVEFENQMLIKVLEREIDGFTYLRANNPIGLFGFVNDVKVDFVKYHQHLQIKEILKVDGVRMLDPLEIMAMKISAILRRAVKKDFWDVAELLKHYSLQDSIDAYSEKFPTQQLLISILYALTYFVDAEDSEEPISLKGQTWPEIKKFIQKKVREYLQ